ncbi:hypothetical protein M3649_04620 [Ureibacillus chungkukjangi]|uniref:hypothetical protein n=1 Tax=Ureibacillus chungkukjangi TaxID=1202712 RepID=UPI000D3B7682|nr:hypothetical protein [Ureibacillus chungkukjangi]MCM3387409.1 hypothetical protein [Ureibacillus chungkukjangi]
MGKREQPSVPQTTKISRNWAVTKILSAQEKSKTAITAKRALNLKPIKITKWTQEFPSPFVS